MEGLEVVAVKMWLLLWLDVARFSFSCLCRAVLRVVGPIAGVDVVTVRMLLLLCLDVARISFSCLVPEVLRVLVGISPVGCE